MFAEYFAEGAAFGFRAFFAALVFVLCCATVLGVLAIVARIFGGDKE